MDKSPVKIEVYLSPSLASKVDLGKVIDRWNNMSDEERKVWESIWDADEPLPKGDTE